MGILQWGSTPDKPAHRICLCAPDIQTTDMAEHEHWDVMGGAEEMLPYAKADIADID